MYAAFVFYEINVWRITLCGSACIKRMKMANKHQRRENESLISENAGASAEGNLFLAHAYHQ